MHSILFNGHYGLLFHEVTIANKTILHDFLCHIASCHTSGYFNVFAAVQNS